MASKKNKSTPIIGVLGTNGTVTRVLHPVGSHLEQAGFNTGNLLYQFAANQLVKAPTIHFPIGKTNDFDDIRNSIDVFHIPAANQLNPEFDLQDWADLIEFMAKPVFIAGLGIQCELSETELKLTEGTINFIRALGKFAPQIGVRGAFTKTVLQRYGVENVVITGCPSNFLNPSVRGSTIAGKLTAAAARHKPRVDYFPGTMSSMREVELHLRNLVHAHNYRYVLQTNELLFRYIDGGEESDIYDYLDWERGLLAPNMTSNEYNRIYRERGTYFLSAAAWMDSASERDVGIGMRMHGMIATIQGGSAGVCVVSDARIQELVTTMGYPHLQVSDVLSSGSLNDIISSVKFNAGEFDDRRKQLYDNYSEIAQLLRVPLRRL